MFRFNDELLLNAEDRDIAAKSFADVYFALDHPALREHFAKLDADSRSAKARSRLIGQLALSFAVLSLLAFPLEPLITNLLHADDNNSVMFKLIASAGALSGVLAIVFGNLGVGFGKAKQSWLQTRLACERLRQWHAQYIVSHATEIATGVRDPVRKAAFLSQRAAEFTRFQRTFLGQIASEFAKHTQRNSAGFVGGRALSEADKLSFWVDPEWADKAKQKLLPDDRPGFDLILAAYEATRIQGQVQYTNYALSEQGRFWSHPAKQIRILGNTSYALVLLAFVANLIALMVAISGQLQTESAILGSIGMGLAILSVGSRALQEALRPQQELQRMENYASSVGFAAKQFRAAKTPAQSIAAAESLERAATDEMLEFLIANDQARFVL